MKNYSIRYNVYYEGEKHLCFTKSFSNLSKAVDFAHQLINAFGFTIHIKTVRVYAFGGPITVKEVIL